LPARQVGRGCGANQGPAAGRAGSRCRESKGGRLRLPQPKAPQRKFMERNQRRRGDPFFLFEGPRPGCGRGRPEDLPGPWARFRAEAAPTTGVVEVEPAPFFERLQNLKAIAALQLQNHIAEGGGCGSTAIRPPRR